VIAAFKGTIATRARTRAWTTPTAGTGSPARRTARTIPPWGTGRAGPGSSPAESIEEATRRAQAILIPREHRPGACALPALARPAYNPPRGARMPDDRDSRPRPKLSRRGFLLGTPLVATALDGCQVPAGSAGSGAPVSGPGPVAVDLRVNGKD